MARETRYEDPTSGLILEAAVWECRQATFDKSLRQASFMFLIWVDAEAFKGGKGSITARTFSVSGNEFDALILKHLTQGVDMFTLADQLAEKFVGGWGLGKNV